MWWAGSNRIDLYLGTRRVAAFRGSESLLESDVDGRRQAFERVEQWLDEHPLKASYRVWLSGGLCRPLALPRVGGASAKELETIAVSLVPDRLGWNDPVAVRIDGVRGANAVAVVMQLETLEAIERMFGKARSRAATIKPWWAEALPEAARRNAECVAVRDCDSICLLAGSDAALDHAAIIHPASDTAAAESALARLRFSWGIDAPALVARLSIKADQGFAEWVDWSA